MADTIGGNYNIRSTIIEGMEGVKTMVGYPLHRVCGVTSPQGNITPQNLLGVVIHFPAKVGAEGFC